MAEIPRDCDTHQHIVGFKYPFPHLMRSLKLQRKIKIVAVGSSSTAGEGDVVPYPARLELLLRGGFHDRMIDVLNRGISGQEAPRALRQLVKICRSFVSQRQNHAAIRHGRPIRGGNHHEISA